MMSGVQTQVPEPLQDLWRCTLAESQFAAAPDKLSNHKTEAGSSAGACW